MPRGRRTLGFTQSDVLSQICSSRKVGKLIHYICVDKLFKTPKCEDKWADFFYDLNLDWGEIYQIPNVLLPIDLTS